MPIIATTNPDQPTELEKRLLMSLVFTTTLDGDEKEDMISRINNCTDYKEFEQLQYKLEDRQQSIHDVKNPSQKDINNHLRKVQ